MGIVKQYCKKTDTYYVYESTSYYRPDKKRCFYKRKLIGKIDKDTGEMIPTGKQGRPKKDAVVEETVPVLDGASREDNSPDGEIERLRKENDRLRSQMERMEDTFRTIQEAIAAMFEGK